MGRFNRTLRKFAHNVSPQRAIWSFEARIARINRHVETLSLDEILALSL